LASDGSSGCPAVGCRYRRLRCVFQKWRERFHAAKWLNREPGPRRRIAAAEVARAGQNGVDVIERRINDKGYDLLGGGKPMEAITIFEFGVVAFPKSADAFDSLGEAYMEAGNKKLSIGVKGSRGIRPSGLREWELRLR
jgi:hypothetical protein